MSYKVDLSELERSGDVSLTQQLVDRFAAAIESGELDPGEKLPTTRALAARGGRQPPHRRARVPAARRARLRDRQRGPRHVRAHARARRRTSEPRRRLADLRAARPRSSPTREQVLGRRLPPRPTSRACCRSPPAGPRRASTRPSELARITAEVFARGGRRGASPTSPPRACSSCASRSPQRGRERGFADGARRDHRHLGRPAGDRPRGARAARAGRRGGDRVADVHRPADRRCAPPARA